MKELKLKHFKHIRHIAVLLLLTTLISGCNLFGEDKSSASTETDNWDEAVWDQSTWQ